MPGTLIKPLQVILLLTVLVSNVLQGLAQTPAGEKTFKVFDATLYANKPDLSVYGLAPITVVYPDSFGRDWYRQNNQELPRKAAVQAVASSVQAKGNPVVLDVEHWRVWGEKRIIQENLKKYITLLEWMKDVAPILTFGYYGVPPLRNYGAAQSGLITGEYKGWMWGNDQLKPLADAVDALYPSLYTFYEDRAGWRKFATAQIAEARRYTAEKPVYVFLWPQYHEINKALAGTYLPEDYWRLELQTARELADGIVIWGGWGNNHRPAIWDENAPWWRVTREFLADNALASPLPPDGIRVH
ncbi:MAG: hypothetical protein JSS26_07120 [Nitrospira sp.]|nr:hypothetical protein [Nitrospira sp.]